jgi:ribose transport system substrate-binding protein
MAGRFAHVLMAAAFVITAACGTDTGSDEPVVAVITAYLGNAATKEVVDDFVADGERRGWEVPVTDTAGDFDKVNGSIQDAVIHQVDAIVLGMGDPRQLSLGLRAATDATIPVFAIDAAVADGIQANVTSDNADLGRKSAAALLAAMGDKGNVIVFTHTPHPGVKLRTEAATRTLEEAGVSIVAVREVQVPGPVDDTRKQMQNLLTAEPDPDAIQGVWAAWDEPALGATQALREADRTSVVVTGVDGQPFAVSEIEKGSPLKATVKQDWKAIAGKTADLVAAYLRDGSRPDQREYVLPGDVIAAAR